MKISIGSPDILFNSLDVHTIETNSGIFIGRNRPQNWRSAEKGHSGFGSIYGHRNHSTVSAHLVLKEDKKLTGVISRSP
ncbi:MAG: hypothetical protein ACQEUT_12075 [Bacillota bacterium]